METPRDAILFRIFIGEADRAAGRSLHRSIVDAAFGRSSLARPSSMGR
jgi:hypothetical protein